MTMKHHSMAAKSAKDRKPAKKTSKGAISMSGPEKLLAAGKAQRGAAKATPSKRVKHKKTTY